MAFFEQVPNPAKCGCEDPHCYGWFVDNIEIREGRFKREDVKLVLHRKNLAKLPKLFIAYMRKHGLDAEDKELYNALIKFQTDIT